MRVPKTILLLACLLAGCGAPAPRVAVIEQSPDLLGLRGPAGYEAEMDSAAERHCAQSNRKPALRYFNREGVRGQTLYTLYQCL